MKSFLTEIKLHGLRPEASSAKNSGFAIDCRNIAVRKWGLEGYSPNFSTMPRIVYGSGYLDLSIDWPFPQIWQTDTGLWIGKRDGLYRVVGSTNVWTATKIASTNTSWPWTLANNPMFPVFASGDCFVYYDYDTATWIAYTGYNNPGTHWNGSWRAPVSVLFHRGQIITVGANIASPAPSDSRIVRWSEIGAFRFLGQTALAERNEAGYRYAEVDDHEILLRALPMGKNVVVYGTFGSLSMRIVESPAPTFGFENLGPAGIVNPLAAGGDDKKHLMVARDGNVWLTSQNQYGVAQIERVGYSEYFKKAQAIVDRPRGIGIVVVVYNSVKDEFYISDGNESFLFTTDGLSRIGKNFTSIFNYENAALTNQFQFDYLGDRPYGIFSESEDSDSAIFQSDAVDLGMNAIKTIETIEVQGTLPEGANLELMVETRANRAQPFRTTKWVRCNDSGVASPIVAGVEMRVNVRCTKVDRLTLEGLRIWWKLNDKRNIRGNYNAAPANA